jgi:hypothetical protein
MTYRVIILLFLLGGIIFLWTGFIQLDVAAQELVRLDHLIALFRHAQGN